MYFLSLAREISKKSKDPSTKVGSVITKNNRIIATGYNGLPKGIKDSQERLNNRDDKLLTVIHGEMNALLHSNEDLTNCTIYVFPFAPCSNCTSAIIQKGIKRVVHQKASPELLDRWKRSLELSYEFLDEAKVERVELEIK